MSHHPPVRARRLAIVTAAAVVLAGCGTFITPAEDEGESLASTVGGHYMEVRVTSSPATATIYLNGRPIGLAPLTARLEVNRDGDLVDDVILTAEFVSGGRSPEQQFARGTKPPTAVSFNPESTSYLGR